ncbi:MULTISPECIES: ABC transporter ATP-binding protein [unclassified Leptolyngbya]|uniref:ABC transporter ATP-binding protein n=1 Tax=unclassified Leptolyngbya TaxID=2650499 RepID=UPI001685E1EB|nr:MULTISPECIES: ABC transporter ATP-binding protein [unclassified Leptolyngbya]MBD1913196.1 ABC transporter ATP-binding protein [Leptolyngbya sp. FACHB-8]MBD2154918.1 ABC transporter ATP-binding protein [Leptolyngbya sp. FACHB-16]
MARQISIWILLGRMIRYAFPLYALDSALWLLIMGLPAVPGLILRGFFNELTQGGDRSLQSPLTWVALLLGVGAARIFAIFTGRVTKTQHRFTMSALLRRNLLVQLLRRPGAEPFSYGPYTSVSPGELISFFREDATQVEDAVVGTNEIAGMGIFALVSLVILFSIQARLTLFVFLPLVAIALILQYAETRIKQYRYASRQTTQQVTGILGEMFAAVQAIQVAGAEDPVLQHFRHLNEQRRQRMVQDQVFTATLNSVLENMVNLGTGLILLLAATMMGDRSVVSFSVGDFALFVYYLAFVTDFLWFSGAFLALIKQTEVAFDRMGRLLPRSFHRHQPQEVEQLVKPAPLYLPSAFGKPSVLPAIARFPVSQTPPLQELRAVNLTYHYPGSDRGITDINLTLKRGSLTVITGPVGSGKTTLLQVLLGLLPTQQGEIYWNGEQVEHPDQFFMPPRSAYLAQVPQLFSTSLRENLLLGLERSEEEMRRAIAQAMLNHDLIHMPEGLDTQIGSRGMRLSGGQIQRVAAARMFLRQPDLLVMDDLSSALDVETEQALWKGLRRILSNQPHQRGDESTPAFGSIHWKPTCVVVSHRSSIQEQADRLIVLKDGKVDSITP